MTRSITIAEAEMGVVPPRFQFAPPMERQPRPWWRRAWAWVWG